MQTTTTKRNKSEEKKKGSRNRRSSSRRRRKKNKKKEDADENPLAFDWWDSLFIQLFRWMMMMMNNIFCFVFVGFRLGLTCFWHFFLLFHSLRSLIIDIYLYYIYLIRSWFHFPVYVFLNRLGWNFNDPIAFRVVSEKHSKQTQKTKQTNKQNDDRRKKKLLKNLSTKNFQKKKINNDNDDNKKESCVCCQPAEWIQGIFFSLFFSFFYTQTNKKWIN